MHLDLTEILKAKTHRWALLSLISLLVLGTHAVASDSSHDAKPRLIAASGAVSWGDDLTKSLGQAKANHKYLLADVYTDWCGWCKRLDKDTFENADMMSYLNSKFVCVKVNAEHGNGKDVAQKYKVAGFPCALVFEPSGKFIGKVSGYLKPGDYKEALESMIKSPPSDPYADE